MTILKEMMNKYSDLEASVLSCILQKPELMEKTILKDEHFKTNYKLWVFLKSFYSRFKNFDLTLMMSIAKSKYRMMEYVMYLLEQEPAPSLFEVYEKRLIEIYQQQKSEAFISKRIFELANDLFVGNINATTFKQKVDDIYAKANELDK